MAAYLRPRESGEIKTTIGDDIGEMVRSLGHVAEYYMSDPARVIEAQTALTTKFIDLWAATLHRFQGGPAKPIVQPEGRTSASRTPNGERTLSSISSSRPTC